MARKLFFGAETPLTGSNPAQDYHVLYKYSSTYTGVLDRVSTYGTVTGDAKITVYGVVSPEANSALLWSDITGNACTADTWTHHDISGGVEVSAASEYFLGFNVDTTSAITGGGAVGSRRIKASTYSTFTAPAPLGTGYASATIGGNIIAYGWEPPTVASIDSSTITQGSPYVLTGTDFMDPSDTLIVEICNNAVYASATVKTAQTVTVHDDTSANFTAVTTGLSGPAWVFVTTDLGQINATGLGVSVGRTVYAFIKRADGVIMPTGKAVFLS